MSPITVVVADDQDLVRAGVASLLDADSGIEVIGQAGDGVEAVRVIEQVRPLVALVDIRMPRLNGIDTISRVRRGPVGDACRLIVLTTFGLDDYVFAAIRAGADAFLLKDAPPEELLRSVRAVAAGDAVMSPSVTRILLDEYLRRPTARRSGPMPQLTDREGDILAGVCEGLSNRQIADRLHIGPATVKTYVSRLLDKFGVDTRVGLVIAAYEAGR
jgi:DNA-binding NarL/FixJ family response regulator